LPSLKEILCWLVFRRHNLSIKIPGPAAKRVDRLIVILNELDRMAEEEMEKAKRESKRVG